MSDDPFAKNVPPETDDRAQIESRLIMLEKSVAGINTFNQTVTAALAYVTERLKDLRSATEVAGGVERAFELYRSAHTLAEASKIFPKTRTVVFVSKGYFGDNAKYAYLAFCDYARDKDVAVHFLTDDRRQHDLLTGVGLPCLPYNEREWTEGDMRALLGAKVTVLSDNFHPYALRSNKAWGMLQGSKMVQLWHGIPIKEVGMRYVLRHDNTMLQELLASAGPYDVFAGPGAGMREEWASMFAFRAFAATGYPRNDIFFREPGARDLLNIDIEIFALFETASRAGKPTILYTPTFRDDVASGWFDKAGIAELADHARAQGYVFAVNLHPYEQNMLDDFRRNYPGIRFVAAGTDIYPVVKHADILITDYSSLAFDYLLCDRPLVFYRPDQDYYVRHSRYFIDGRERMTPGAVVSQMGELVRAVDAAADFVRNPETDPFRAMRRELRAKLFDHADGNAGRRVCEVIMGLIENNQA